VGKPSLLPFTPLNLGLIGILEWPIHVSILVLASTVTVVDELEWLRDWVEGALNGRVRDLTF
jgi:hypothetical protein